MAHGWLYSMDVILNRITSFLANDDDIDEERLEVIRYGLEILLLKIVFYITSIALGILMHSFWECLIFLISLSSIRTLAGGYHADTRMKCFIESMCMLMAILAALKVFQESSFSYVVLSLVAFASVTVIWVLCPIDTENKRLTSKERKILRIKTRSVLIIETVICLSAYLLDYDKAACTIMLALIVTAVLMVIGGIKNIKQISP